jgi:hypothetical protein
MTIVNQDDGALDNSADEFRLSISDTNNHDLPDTDGDDSAGGGYWNGVTAERVAAYVENNQDQELTATLKREPVIGGDLGPEVDDTAGVTIASGDAEVLLADKRAPMGAFRVVVSFSSAPSGTNDTVVGYDWHRR